MAQDVVRIAFRSAALPKLIAPDGLTVDDDLKNLRQNPHFQQLVATLRRPPQNSNPDLL
jgi:hypothetical protein